MDDPKVLFDRSDMSVQFKLSMDAEASALGMVGVKEIELWSRKKEGTVHIKLNDKKITISANRALELAEALFACGNVAQRGLFEPQPQEEP